MIKLLKKRGLSNPQKLLQSMLLLYKLIMQRLGDQFRCFTDSLFVVIDLIIVYIVKCQLRVKNIT